MSSRKDIESAVEKTADTYDLYRKAMREESIAVIVAIIAAWLSAILVLTLDVPVFISIIMLVAVFSLWVTSLFASRKTRKARDVFLKSEGDMFRMLLERELESLEEAIAKRIKEEDGGN